MAPTQRERVIEDLENARVALAGCDRDWARLPWVGTLVLLTIPAGIVAGKVGVFVVLAGCLFMGGVATYIINSHRFNFRRRVRDLEAELRRLPAAAP